MQEFNCLLKVPRGSDKMTLLKKESVISCYLINSISNINNAKLVCLQEKYKKEILNKEKSLKNYLVGTITISDRAYKGQYEEDKGTKALLNYFKSLEGFTLGTQTIVPDEETLLLEKLNELTKTNHNLIITTGGTGLTKRDITSKVVRSFIDKEATGLESFIIAESAKLTKFASLSNPVIGVKDNSLIITLPGNPKAIAENLNILESIIPHALNQVTSTPDFH
jgi:molybdenum cofactor synthesis domain-containing protein